MTILYHINEVYRNIEVLITTQNKKEKILMERKVYLQKLSKVLELTINKEKLNTCKEGLPYLGTFNTVLFEADLFIDIQTKVAKFYIEVVNRDLPMHIINELSHIVWNYYDINRQLFTRRKNIYQVAIVKLYGIYLLVNKDDIESLLINIRESIRSSDNCSKYKKIGYCSCETCVYRLFKGIESDGGINFVTMPKKGVDQLFDKFKPELKGIKVEEWLTD